MKNLIKLLIPLVIITLSLNSMAQGFGVRAGVNFQNINGKDSEGDQLENNLIPGFNLGVNYEIPVGTDIYFQPGLLFSMKGAKSETTILTVDFDEKVLISYIELPLNLVFKPLLGSGHMLLGFGPYLAYGVGGKYKLDSDVVNNEFDIKFKNSIDDQGEDEFYLRPFDAGANFIIGYELANMLSLQLNAQLGLVNILPESSVDDKSVWKNTGFGLSVGYRF